MRGHCAVGFQQVGRREKGGEGSAWTLCSGLPKVESREKREEGSAWTLCSGLPLSAPKRASHALLSLPFSLPYRRAQARQPRTAFFSLIPNLYFTSAPATHCFLFPHPQSLPYKRASHALLSPPSSPIPTLQARQPRTAFSSLIPNPYLTSAPKRASHALLSLPSSLLPTLQARPSAPATHCILFPHP